MKASRSILALAVSLFGLAVTAQAQWTQQNIPLRPGWNAVFLEVHPEPADCDAWFAGLPVESVWDWNRDADSVQFIQDPATLVPGAPGWLTWFPPGHPLADQSSLFVLRDARPYLIKVADNAQPVTWTVTGRPSLRRITWRPGEVNLVGFRVGATAPTFQVLFDGEPGVAGQPVYRLAVTGTWQAVANLATARPQAGEAYWVRCRLPAQRTATIELETGSRQGLVFPAETVEATLRVRNTSAAARNVSVRLLASATPPSGQPPLAGPFPLEYWKADYANVQIGWEPLPPTLNYTALPVGAEWNIRLGVRRPATSPTTPGAEYQGLIEVRDDLGSRWLVPIRAHAGPPASAAAAIQPAQDGASWSHAGLWVGEAVIRAVSQPAHPGNGTLPRPAGGEFSFRLILHVDAGGNARLLQRAYLVRRPPVLGPDPDNPGFDRVTEPARTVVLTDEALIPSVIGLGEVTGRRISSAAFGFDQPLELGGGRFGTGSLHTTVTLGHDDPLNPFQHAYHPDHDNLDARFEEPLPDGRESFTVTRQLSLEFTGEDPLNLNPPGWGTQEMGGTYRETITGLHRTALQIGGTFRLVRAAMVPDLNDAGGGLVAPAIRLE